MFGYGLSHGLAYAISTPSSVRSSSCHSLQGKIFHLLLPALTWTLDIVRLPGLSYQGSGPAISTGLLATVAGILDAGADVPVPLYMAPALRQYLKQSTGRNCCKTGAPGASGARFPPPLLPTGQITASPRR